MAILIPEVVQFAAGNTDFYEAAYMIIIITLLLKRKLY